MNTELRIYAASLSDYNAGNLHGAWIDCAGKTADELQQEVSAMLRTSKHPNVMVPCIACHDFVARNDCSVCRGSFEVPSAEEYAIHDHEGFGNLLEEYTSLSRVAELAAIAAELGGDWPAYVAYADTVGGEPSADDFLSAYSGEWDSVRAYAEELIDDIGELKRDSLAARYFDYDAFARDLERGGDIFAVPAEHGTVYIFSN